MEQTMITCRVCGRQLPQDKFKKTKYGTFSSVCKDCAHEKMLANKANKKKLANYDDTLARVKAQRLEDFTARELMEELARRGYKGKLQYVKIEEIDIANF